MNRLLCCAIATLVALPLWADEPPPRVYRIISIPTLGGPADRLVFGLNASGGATGVARTPANDDHAYRYHRGRMDDLGTLGGLGSLGSAINDAGEVTGVSEVQAGVRDRHAFLYHDGHMNDLGTLGGRFSWGQAINSRGEVAGYAELPGGFEVHAFLYAEGRLEDLGTLGGTESQAYGINAKGVVVGSSTFAGDTLLHAFLYRRGRMRDLGALGTGYSEALAINCVGEVTGHSAVANEAHAFLYARGHMKDLGTLPGDTDSAGLGINSRGEIVGASGVSINGTSHAFIYREHQMIDLGTLIDPNDPLLPATIIEAVAINDRGEIALNGTDATGALRGYLLVPRRTEHEDAGSASDLARVRACSRDEEPED